MATAPETKRGFWAELNRLLDRKQPDQERDQIVMWISISACLFAFITMASTHWPRLDFVCTHTSTFVLFSWLVAMAMLAFHAVQGHVLPLRAMCVTVVSTAFGLALFIRHPIGEIVIERSAYYATYYYEFIVDRFTVVDYSTHLY